MDDNTLSLLDKWQAEDQALAQLLAEQNMSLDGLRQFLDAAWAVVVAWDNEPDMGRVIRAAGKLSGVAEAATGKHPRAQDGT